jgi:hypothetical protein
MAVLEQHTLPEAQRLVIPTVPWARVAAQHPLWGRVPVCFAANALPLMVSMHIASRRV